MPVGFGGHRIVVRVHELPCPGAPPDTHIEVKMRHVSSLAKDELCRAFGYDPIRTSFDLPRSASVAGGDQSGYGSRGTRTVDGYVLFSGEPIGRLYVAYDGEKFKDVDPYELTR
jgi:hypothetical protein